MRRFINSIWLFVLLWSGPLVFTAGWCFMVWTAGFLNSLIFIGLMSCSAHCTQKGPTWAKGYVDRRVKIRQAKTDTLEGRVMF